jgi:hypothetical protein
MNIDALLNTKHAQDDDDRLLIAVVVIKGRKTD